MVLFIDSFLFNGEPIVKLRLEYLYNYVDFFYIVESLYTFTGNEKDSYYIDTYKSWFEPYLNKIKFIKINTLLNTLPFDDNIKKCFHEEKLQRNYIRNILLNNFDGKDFILALCDVDEIYDISESKDTLFNSLNDKVILLTMKMYFYNFNFFLHDHWEMAYLISSTMLRIYEDLDYIRVYKLGSDTIRRNSGWHFTYFMSPEDIQRKIKSFSHSDINRYPFNDIDYLRFVVSKGIDYQQRNDHILQNIPIENEFHNYPELFRKYSIRKYYNS
jgi:beta-1,4-mannosyl-glycoprotein beta-1,4-N-acetylglucosaminyltransferase